MSQHFNSVKMPKLIEFASYSDKRGEFSKLFCMNEMRNVLGARHIWQVNKSSNEHKGTIRGMHFQRRPREEIKIVQALTGSILDVVVDVRQGSPTFLQYFEFELCSTKNQMLIVPEGFAHGFQTLTDHTTLLYFHTNRYCKDYEDALHFNDPRIGIGWPYPPVNVSKRDQSHKFITEGFVGF